MKPAPALIALWVLGALLTPASSAPAAVLPGIDTFAEKGFPGLAGKRVGLVTNPSGVDSRGIRTAEILSQQKNFRLVALFAPEHGFDGKVPAGKYVESHRDARTGIWVHSLYGKTRKPSPEMLRGIDVLVYDLQDLGCRSYTFISTLGLVMQAASEAGLPVYVLDRPNPLGGDRVEGPGVPPDRRTFVGQYDIPYIYGLTSAELAWWINDRWLDKPCELHVFKMNGWQRSMVWADTGLKWIPTSPNIPSVGSTWGYVATGLLGDIGITNGAKVVPYPFEVVAGENVDGARLAALLNSRGVQGVRFEPVSFRATSGKFANVRYSGVRLRVDPRRAGTLLGLNFMALDALRTMRPGVDYFSRATADGLAMFDKINGGSGNRLAWQRGNTAADLQRAWASFENHWRKERQPFLLYH